MRTIKLAVAYDGSCYHGFQKQKEIVTVQGILEEMLSKLCGEKIAVAGSGRTDTGVHALGQIVTFTTSGRIPCANIVRAARSLLPSDIVVLSAEEMPEGFHARFSAKWKIYQYKLLVNKQDNPFMVRYAWQLREKLNIQAMNEAAALLAGTHDFSAFRSSGSVDSSPVKTIYEACWQQRRDELIFRIAGDGFLYHMVRNLVWSLVQVGLGKRTVRDFNAELHAQRCEFLNEPAPPQGLYLENVFYESYAVIETERLYLRRLQMEDALQLRNILQDEEVMYAWEHAFSDEEVQGWLEENLRRYEQDGFSYFAAVEKSSGRIIGVAGPLLENIDGSKTPGIAYILAKNFWHQGFAVEAAQGSIKYLRERGCSRIIAEIRPENNASVKVAQALGMRLAGETIVKNYYNKDMLHHIYYLEIQP